MADTLSPLPDSFSPRPDASPSQPPPTPATIRIADETHPKDLRQSESESEQRFRPLTKSDTTALAGGIYHTRALSRTGSRRSNGQQAFEGLKAFRTPGDKDIQIFRPDRNAARMQHSAEVISMPPVPIETFIDACRAAVALNAEWVPPHETGAAMYVRPQMYGSSAQLGLSPPEEYTFCVYVLPTGVFHGVHPVKALILDDFDRAAPNGTGNAKLGGNYAPVLKHSDKARSEGYDITLHLDSATHSEIDEFSTSGFIGVLVDGDSHTMVVPDSHNVIKSVTSDSVQDIAKSFGWKVEQRSVSQGRRVGTSGLCFR